MPKQNPSSPNSVIGKVCSILAQFTLQQPVLSLDEIAQASGVPRTSTHRILHSLMDEGYISLTPAGYKLGLRIFQLGMVARQNFGFEEVLGDILKPLAEEIKETVIAATLDGNEILYLYVIQSPNPLRFVAGVGQRREPHFGATGLALLSVLDDETRRNLVTEPLPQYTANSVTDLEAWLARLDDIAQTGVAIEYGEYFEGIEAIAVPVKGTPPLALTVVGPEERMHPQEARIKECLRLAARQLEMMALL